MQFGCNATQLTVTVAKTVDRLNEKAWYFRLLLLYTGMPTSLVPTLTCMMVIWSPQQIVSKIRGPVCRTPEYVVHLQCRRVLIDYNQVLRVFRVLYF